MSAPTLLYQDNLSEVWIGDCLDLEHVEQIMHGRFASASILDAPYSARTHKGHAAGKVTCDRARAWEESQRDSLSVKNRRAARSSKQQNAEIRYARRAKRRDIDYANWSREDVAAWFARWGERGGWIVSITDHELFREWDRYARLTDRVTFTPIPLVETGSRVRMAGDGPSSWTCFCAISRPRSDPWCRWGALRGAYVVPGERRFNSDDHIKRIMGGKPLLAMLRIVEDYSNRGDLVVDQTCGAGTTLMAAKTLGRRSVGIERDPETAEKAAANLRNTRCQMSLELDVAAVEQKELFG